MELTVDFPAPGGPAMTSRVDMRLCVSASHSVIKVALDDAISFGRKG
jgi:hypothetical protein